MNYDNKQLYSSNALGKLLKKNIIKAEGKDQLVWFQAQIIKGVAELTPCWVMTA